MDLRQTVALITGSKRIGAVVGEELARAGARVALAYRHSRTEADAAAARIRTAGGDATTFAADLSEPEACAALVEGVVASFGKLDILVNLASVYQATRFDALTAADFEAALAVDLRASYLCAGAAAPHMRQQGGGRIVNCSDWVAASGRPRYRGFLPYYVAKAGVIALTEALALELAADRILVNAVALGPILAPPGTSAEKIRAIERATPLGHWGGEAVAARTIRAVIESDFTTGETIRVDGGKHLA